MKKIVIGFGLLLIITQITFIILQITHVIRLPIPWLVSPALVVLLLGTVWYVLDAEKKERE